MLICLLFRQNISGILQGKNYLQNCCLAKCVLYDNQVRWVWLEVVVPYPSPVGAMLLWMLWLYQRYPVLWHIRHAVSFMLLMDQLVHTSLCVRNLRVLRWKKVAHCLVFRSHIPIVHSSLPAVHYKIQLWFFILVRKSVCIGMKQYQNGNRLVCGMQAIHASWTLSCSA